MSKSKPKHDPKAMPLTMKSTETLEQAKARAALMPSINAASVIQSYQGNLMGSDADMSELVEGLRSTIQAVNGGDLANLESMLLMQATALQTMFTSLARRAANQEYLKHMDAYMSLALKAQAQSRATISALVDLKYPRQATFIKQANVAHGPQQVNNGTDPSNPRAHAYAEELKPDQTELLEAPHGGTSLDRGTTAAATRGDPAVEAVETVNRPKVCRRKGQGITQR